MLKKISAIVLTLAATFIIAGCQEKSESKSIAVVDQELVYRDSKIVKLAVDHLEVISQELQTELMAIQEEAQKIDDPEKSRRILEEGFAEMQQRFAAEQQHTTTKVTELFEASVEKCRVSKKASVVLSSDLLLAKDPATDITSEVIKVLDETDVKFTKVADEAAAEKADADKADADKADAPAADKADADKADADKADAPAADKADADKADADKADAPAADKKENSDNNSDKK